MTTKACTRTFVRIVRPATAAVAILGAIAAVGPAAAEDAPVLEEIIVTAQKREERLRDVPASVSAVGGQTLEEFGASQLSDYATNIPGFVVTSSGTPGRSRITIRGLGSTQSTAMVGTYLDDAPLGSSNGWAGGASTALDLLPYDLERVEVLRGPQGTLYGANTMGGLLKYVTRAPDLYTVTARAGVDTTLIEGAGGFGYGLRASVNLPVVEGKVGVRASVYRQRTPGYVDNAPLGVEDENDVLQQGGRLSLRWDLSERTSVRLSGLLQESEAESRASISLAPVTLEPVHGDLTSANRLLQPVDQTIRNVAGTLTHELDWATLSSITGYSELRTDDLQDYSDLIGDLFPILDPTLTPGLSSFDTALDVEKLTQELRLASASGQSLEWLLGGFYTTEEATNRQVSLALDPATRREIPTLSGFLTTVNPTDYEEYAAFGQVTVPITEAFDVTGGLRWSSNEQTWAQVVEVSRLAIIGLPVGTTSGTSSEDVWTYSLSGRYRFGEDSMAYVRVASGYRPGGPNTALPNVPPQVDADTLVSYEVGVKAGFLDGRGTLDAAVFYIDWSDIQVLDSEAGVNFFVNGGKAKSQGAEVSATVLLLEGLQLTATGAYTDATLEEDRAGLGSDGDRLPYAPRWSASLAADYEHPITAALSLRLGANVRYVGERWSGVGNQPSSLLIPSYEVLDATASVVGDGWTVGLFARNLTDERGYLSLAPVSNIFGQPKQVRASIIEPRSVGIRADFTF